MVLELTVARLGWQFNLDYGFTAALVFWALGWSMVALATLVRLPLPAAGAIGVAMILGHNVLDRIQPSDWGSWSWLWTVLHSPGDLVLWPEVHLFVVYPLVPWVGVMAAGYTLGPLVTPPPAARDRAFLRLGLALTAACVVLRLMNVYGDPSPWSGQASPGRTMLSFLNTTKYPPSVLFLLMTLGPAIAILPSLSAAPAAWPRFCGRSDGCPSFSGCSTSPLFTS